MVWLKASLRSNTLQQCRKMAHKIDVGIESKGSSD